jgi:hypothetical protein
VCAYRIRGGNHPSEKRLKVKGLNGLTLVLEMSRHKIVSYLLYLFSSPSSMFSTHSHQLKNI